MDFTHLRTIYHNGLFIILFSVSQTNIIVDICMFIMHNPLTFPVPVST